MRSRTKTGAWMDYYYTVRCVVKRFCSDYRIRFSFQGLIHMRRKVSYHLDLWNMGIWRRYGYWTVEEGMGIWKGSTVWSGDMSMVVWREFGIYAVYSGNGIESWILVYIPIRPFFFLFSYSEFGADTLTALHEINGKNETHHSHGSLTFRTGHLGPRFLGCGHLGRQPNLT